MDDQVFVVLTGEGLVVKRLRRRDDPWELNSDNPAYESQAVTARTESPVRSRGRDHRPPGTRPSPNERIRSGRQALGPVRAWAATVDCR